MTNTAVTPGDATDVGPTTPGRGRALPSAVIPAAAAALAAADAAIVGALAAQGSWYADDLDFLAAGHASDLDVDYLSHPVNDHFVPGLRFVYWAFAHLAPLNYPATIAFRIVLVLAANAAMYRLLVLLMGRRPAVLGALAFYAFIPLTLPSDLSLSSAVNLLPSHISGILLVDAVVRYAAGRRLMYAATATLWFLVGLAFWEKSAIIVVTAVLLVVGFTMPGGWRRRLGDLAAMGRLWAPLAGAATLFGVGWLATRDGDSVADRDLGGLTEVTEIMGWAWVDTVAPAAIGGPWEWWSAPDIYLGLASPPLLGSVVAQLAVVAAIVMGWRRVGRRSLVAWTMVASYVVTTATLLGIGRSLAFGDAPATHFHYWSDLAVTLTIALVCAFAPLNRVAIIDRATHDRPAHRTITVPGWYSARPVVAATAIAAVSIAASASTFIRRWDDNPAGDYIATLEAELTNRPGTTLYDLPLPPTVLSGLAEYHHLSDITPMMDVQVTYNGPDDTHIVTDDGRLATAQLAPRARNRPGDPGECAAVVTGRSRVAIPLDQRTGRNEWFVRINYLANPEAHVAVWVAREARPPTLVTPDGGATWPSGLDTAVIQTPPDTDLDRLVIAGLDDNVHLCVGDVIVGRPVPWAPPS